MKMHNLVLMSVLFLTLFLNNSVNAQTTPTRIRNMEWHSDGQLLAIAADNGLWLFDAIESSYQLLDNNWYYDVSWNADGSLLGAITPHPDPEFFSEKLQLWDIEQQEIVVSIDVDTYSGAYIEFHPLINNYITMSGYYVVAMDAITGEEVLYIYDESPSFYTTQARWSPDGIYLATTHMDCIHRVWEFATGNLLYELPASGNCTGMAWHPESNQIAVGDGEGLQIWHLNTGSPTQGLLLPTSVSPLGKDIDWVDGQLFVPSISGAIDIWDTQSGELIISLSNLESILAIPKINPNGRDLALAHYVESLELDILQPFLGSISGIVWEDADLNHSFTDLDRRLADITVELYTSSDLAIPIATTTTQTDGSYNFAVDPGSYRVKFIAPDGDGVFLTIEDSDDSNIIDAEGYTAEITLGPAETYEDLNAGIKPPLPEGTLPLPFSLGQSLRS